MTEQERILQIERELALLPKGSVVTKTVKGREYSYHRTSEQGVRKERYVQEGEAANLRADIARRKRIEEELRALTAPSSAQAAKESPAAPSASAASAAPPSARAAKAARATSSGGAAPTIPAAPSDKSAPPAPSSVATAAEECHTMVRIGDRLRAFADPVRGLKHRDCFANLQAYLNGEADGRVFILFGLRRTGKTTLMRQAIASMSGDRLQRTAFVQVMAGDTLASLSGDLRRFEQRGIDTVFIDEVTLLEDFIDNAALFSDIFAASGMKVVLSGTDSLGFIFAEDDQLYDRCVIQHTTFIPYREFEGVLGIRGIDEFIRYGGTMSMGGKRYNETSLFSTGSRANEYVDTAIARNIQHALRGYQAGGHFRSLYELYEANELTNVVNRVVEDINHRFTLEVLTRDFRSSDLGISAGNLRRDRENPTDVLDRVDTEAVVERLRRVLEIRNVEERSLQLDETHAAEIREYLMLLDLTREIPVVGMPGGGRVATRTVIAQPGLRYAQAKELVKSLLNDPVLNELSLGERNRVFDRVLTEVRGRMMEDIVLLETQAANPDKQVFVLQFPVGEFDMVVFDPQRAACSIFEVKHSDQRDARQYRHLVDAEKRAQTEHRFGKIERTAVLYRGESCTEGSVRYWNVEEYLKSLGGEA